MVIALWAWPTVARQLRNQNRVADITTLFERSDYYIVELSKGISVPWSPSAWIDILGVEGVKSAYYHRQNSWTDINNWSTINATVSPIPHTSADKYMIISDVSGNVFDTNDPLPDQDHFHIFRYYACVKQTSTDTTYNTPLVAITGERGAVAIVYKLEGSTLTHCRDN